MPLPIFIPVLILSPIVAFVSYKVAKAAEKRIDNQEKIEKMAEILHQCDDDISQKIINRSKAMMSNFEIIKNSQTLYLSKTTYLDEAIPNELCMNIAAFTGDCNAGHQNEVMNIARIAINTMEEEAQKANHSLSQHSIYSCCKNGEPQAEFARGWNF